MCWHIARAFSTALYPVVAQNMLTQSSYKERRAPAGVVCVRRRIELLQISPPLPPIRDSPPPSDLTQSLMAGFRPSNMSPSLFPIYTPCKGMMGEVS